MTGNQGYMNDLSDNLESTVKLFLDNTSIYPVVRNPINASQKLIMILIELVFGKLSFNPDQSKQAQEVIFSRKINKVYLPSLLFNNSTIQQI